MPIENIHQMELSTNSNLKENNPLYDQAKLLETSSAYRFTTKSLDHFGKEILSESEGSSLCGNVEEYFYITETKERFESQKHKTLVQLSQTLDKLKHQDNQDMLEAIDSTLKKLQERTNLISESLEKVQKKQQRVQDEIKDNIDIVKEMRMKAQELLKRQELLSKNYRNVEIQLNNTKPSEYQSASSTRITGNEMSRGNNYSDNDDDEEPVSLSITKSIITYPGDDDCNEGILKRDNKDRNVYSYHSDEEKLELKEGQKYVDGEDYYSDAERSAESTVKILDASLSEDEQLQEGNSDLEAEKSIQSDGHRTEDDDDEFLREEEARNKNEELTRKQNEEFHADEEEHEDSDIGSVENQEDTPPEADIEDEEFNEEEARRLAEEHMAQLLENEDAE